MAYPDSFRWKVIKAYNNKEGSIRKLAKKFSVSPGFIKNLLKLYKETGGVSAKKSPGRPNHFEEQGGLQKLAFLQKKRKGLSDGEYALLLEQHFGIVVSRMTINRASRKIKQSKQKIFSQVE